MMEMLQNGLSKITKIDIINKPNYTSNSNNQNTQPSVGNENQEQKFESSSNEILLLIDIKVNELNQLSNIYTTTVDQIENKVLDFQNIEIGQESTSVKLKQALCVINGIQKKFSASSNFFIVYPKKAIPNVLFRIFRQYKFSPGELNFTNTYISLGQLMPSTYVLDESLQFNNLAFFIDITKDDDVTKQILPIQSCMSQNNNQNSLMNTQNLDSSVIGQDIYKNNSYQQFKSHSSSIDLHNLQMKQVSNTYNQNQIKKEGIETLEVANSIKNLSQNEDILSIQQINPLQSSTSNTPTQQLQQNNSSLFIQNEQQKFEQSQKQNNKNISQLFDLSNNIIKSDSVQTKSIFQNDISSSNVLQSSTGIQETTIFQSLQSPMINRSYSTSLDSGSKIGGSSLFSGSSAFNLQGNDSNRNNNTYKPSSSWILNSNALPLAPIQEKPQQEKSENDQEKIDICFDYPTPQKMEFSLQKDYEIQSNNGNGQISSSSSICSSSTFSSKQVMNEQYANGQQKGQKQQSQLSFFILVLKLIKYGLQLKKECLINFKNNLTQEIKLKYSKQIQEILLDAQKKLSNNEMNLEENQIQQNQQIQSKQNFQTASPRQTEQLLSKQSSQITQFKQNQSILSRKQSISQTNSPKVNKEQSHNLFQEGDSKTIMQENLMARSLEVQQKLSKNEENKTLDLLFVIDFECNQPGYEIIEFPVLVIDLKKQRIIDTFHTYVKPTLSPKINSYISRITGIVQKDVATAPPFVQVIQKVESFLSKYKDYEGCILYDCDSDCKYIKNEFINKNYMPKSDLFFSYINLRNVFPLEISGGVINKSLSHAQQILQMEFQGSKHKGIDDARNQALVCIELAKRGFNFSQFMIQSQFIKQEPRQCVKNNLFNLYEYNSKFLLIKLDSIQQEVPIVQQTNQRTQQANIALKQKKYIKFTCFLTEKNDQLNQIYRIKDSTFYFDLVNAQASGAGTYNTQSNTRNINFRGQTSSENINNNSDNSQNQNMNSGNSISNNGNQINQNGQSNYNQKGQKHENQKGKSQQQNIDEHVKQVEKSFYNSFSSYLKKFNIQRNKTALVLLGFDKNEFSNFQKSFNLLQYEKDLLYNEKTIYIDDNLVQFTGFLDVYKMKDPNSQRKNSVSMTPHKNRKRAMSDDIFTTNLRINQFQTIQFQGQTLNNSHQNTTQVNLRKNSLKNFNLSPIMKPQSTTQLPENINLSLNNLKDDYIITHQADMNKQGDFNKNNTRSSRKRSNFKEFHLNCNDSNGIQKQIERQQEQTNKTETLNQKSSFIQNQTEEENQQNKEWIPFDSIQESNSQNTNTTTNNNMVSSSNTLNNSQQGNSYTKEQISQFILNDEFINNKKLQEYQDLAYHWQYINNKPK